MKNNQLETQKARQILKQRPPKLIYHPVQQFKHRDRGIHIGRVK